MMKRLLITLTLLFGVSRLLAQTLVPMQAIVGDAVLVHDAQTVGTHDPSQSQGSWVTLCSFQVDSLSNLGFAITAELAGTGWSRFSGSSQGSDFNVFTGFRLTSSDSANYNGSKSMSSILPTWSTVDTSQQIFTNGTQTSPMYNWLIEGQATWNAAPSLLEGSYIQTITITIAVGDGT